ncbi:MAG: UDP-2,3-diacylglucosamine pyrophosphatase LpxH, partial [Hyphomicrobiaceae bacterium]
HIHRAASKQIHNVHYVNTGDWVESATAFVEHQDGTLELIRWAEQMENDKIHDLSITKIEAAA